MPQYFSPSANGWIRALLLGIPILAGVFCAVVFAAARSEYWTGVGTPQAQPVPFSHAHHAGELGIDCRYCHTSVETSAFAGLPPTETCMTCHSQVWKDAPVLQPVRDSLQNHRPLRWTRVHDLPDYVAFDHSIHVAKGVGCSSCHGRVDQMPLTLKNQELEMRWCLDCHRQPEKALRSQADIYRMQYEAPPNQDALGTELALQNKIPRERLTDCDTCHR